MAYSQKVIAAVMSAPKTQGNLLGRWAIRHNMPVTKISRALGVSRQTVYNWFTGTDIFVAYKDRADLLLRILQASSNADDAWRRVCEEFNLVA